MSLFKNGVSRERFRFCHFHYGRSMAPRRLQPSDNLRVIIHNYPITDSYTVQLLIATPQSFASDLRTIGTIGQFSPSY